jgi:dienelactone hydrolase
MGDSLGGAMAGRFVTSDPAIKGIVFWASYPDVDLSQSGRLATSIYGSRDGLATVQVVESSKPRLPAEAVFVKIEGGNHAYFGDYGPQARDQEATISPEAAFDQVVAATSALLGQVRALQP